MLYGEIKGDTNMPTNLEEQLGYVVGGETGRKVGSIINVAKDVRSIYKDVHAYKKLLNLKSYGEKGRRTVLKRGISHSLDFKNDLTEAIESYSPDQRDEANKSNGASGSW